MSTTIIPYGAAPAQAYVPRIGADSMDGIPKKVAEDIIVDATNKYIASLIGEPLPKPSLIREQLLGNVNAEFEIENTAYKGADRHARLKALVPVQIAMILIELHNVVRVVPVGRPVDRDQPLLGVYVADELSAEHGCYDTSDLGIRAVAQQYAMTLDDRGWKQVRDQLAIAAPAVTQSVDRDLVPVDNGVFNYRTKQLLPFTRDLVFLNKVRTALDENAASPVLSHPDGTLWDVEAWFDSLFDDPERVQLAWEMVGAVVRPYVRWNKAAFLSNQSGSNGKGSYVEMLEALVGAGGYVSMPIANFSKEFLLEPLLAGGPILTHENPVGAFSSEADAFKCVVTNDSFTINRKNRPPVQHQHWGFMIQCVNGLPKFKDRSESLLRRILPVPFDKRFYGATDRPEIKEDFLKRPDVLQYVLKRVLLDMPAYYSLSEPAACTALLGELRENNDPVSEFWHEHEERFVWDLLPFKFLYACFRSWFRATNPSGTVVSQRSFTDSLMPLVEASEMWQCEKRDKQVHTGKKMQTPELLIHEYELDEWADPTYTGRDLFKKCTTAPAMQYRGVERAPGAARPTAIPTTVTDDDDDLSVAA